MVKQGMCQLVPTANNSPIKHSVK